MTVYVRIRGGKIRKSIISEITFNKNQRDGSQRHIICVRNETRCYNISDVGTRLFLSQEDAEKGNIKYENKYSLKTDLDLGESVIILQSGKTSVEHIQAIALYYNGLVAFKTRKGIFYNNMINKSIFPITKESQDILINTIINYIRKISLTPELGNTCAEFITTLKEQNINFKAILTMADLFAYTRNIAEYDKTTKGKNL